MLTIDRPIWNHPDDARKLSSQQLSVCFVFQVQSEFILESERESFIEQVREVIEMADEKGEGMKEGFPQVQGFFFYTLSIHVVDQHLLNLRT